MNAKEKNSSEPKVVIKKIINATRERVFDAWTKPEQMQHWFVGGPGRSIPTADLRVGGKFTNEMLIEDCEGNDKKIKSYPHHGEYLEILPPERLVFTWNSHAVQNTVVTIELRTVKEGTEITLTHVLPSTDNCEGHQEGWTFALSGLAAFIKDSHQS